MTSEEELWAAQNERLDGLRLIHEAIVLLCVEYKPSRWQRLRWKLQDLKSMFGEVLA